MGRIRQVVILIQPGSENLFFPVSYYSAVLGGIDSVQVARPYFAHKFLKLIQVENVNGFDGIGYAKICIEINFVFSPVFASFGGDYYYSRAPIHAIDSRRGGVFKNIDVHNVIRVNPSYIIRLYALYY